LEYFHLRAKPARRGRTGLALVVVPAGEEGDRRKLQHFCSKVDRRSYDIGLAQLAASFNLF
jgi:hypothetical protein